MRMDTEEYMNFVERSMKEEHTYVRSQIDGLSDLLWSMAKRCTTDSNSELIEWFYRPIPGFNNRIPIDIMREDGEKALFEFLLKLPC